MAQVLLCEDEKLGRLVAVKRLHAESAEDVERRFLREARLGAALNHPNLVSVFDTVVDDDGLLIVMEYVEGEPLTRALRAGPLAPQRVVRMARDLAAGLDHAHSHGVIHRDVKPGNVLLRTDGVAKLADLGIATAVDLTRITRSGELLGTAAYMAPEQLEGGEPRAASDVYALAAVCFEALAGQRPRRGRSAIELAHRIATEPPPDLREYLPGAPPAAAEALRRGMARDPDERPASAGDLAAELGRALDGDVASHEPPLLAAAAPTRLLAPDPEPEPQPEPQPQPEPEPPSETEPGPGPPSEPQPQVHRQPDPTPRPPVGPPRGRSAPQRPGARRRAAAAFVPVVLLVLVAAAAAAVLLTSGGDGDGRPSAQQRERADRGAQPGLENQKPKESEESKESKKAKKPKKPSPEQSAPATATEPAQPAPQQAAPTPAASIDPARGAQLNDQGFALMQRGDFADAVPILQQAVAAWPQDSGDLRYGYALFNLGKALNRSGRAAEAIPYLEKRLRWADQRETVQAELDLARRNAQG